MRKKSESENVMKINRKTFLGVYYTFFVNGIMGLILGTIIFFLSADYGIDYDMQGYLMSANSIGNLLASFSISISTFWLGRKRSIIIISAMILLALGGIISTSVIWLLFVFFFLVGLGRGSVSNVNYAIINDAATGNPVYLNILSVCFAVGAFMTPLLSSFLIKAGYGWKVVVAVGICFAASMLFVYVLVPIDETFVKKSRSKPVLESEQGEKPFYKNSIFYLAALVLFFYLGAESTVNNWMITYLIDTGRMNEADSQIILSLIWAVIIVGRMTTVFLSTRIQKTRLILVASSGAAIMFCFFAVSSNSVVTRITILLFSFFFSGIYSTAIAVPGKILKGSTAAMGTLLAIAGAGSILMPMMTGLVAKSFGIHSGMIPTVVSIMLTVVFAIALRVKVKE